MTWLGALNRYVLQWYGVRLSKVMCSQGKELLAWDLMIGVLPTTGWDRDFVFFPGCPMYLRLWKAPEPTPEAIPEGS